MRDDSQIRMTHLLGLGDGGFGLLDRKEGPYTHTVDGPPVIHPRCHASPQRLDQYAAYSAATSGSVLPRA